MKKENYKTKSFEIIKKLKGIPNCENKPMLLPNSNPGFTRWINYTMEVHWRIKETTAWRETGIHQELRKRLKSAMGNSTGSAQNIIHITYVWKKVRKALEINCKHFTKR